MAKEAREIIEFQERQVRASEDPAEALKLKALQAARAAVDHAEKIGALPPTLPQFSQFTELAQTPSDRASTEINVNLTPADKDRQLREGLRPFVQEYQAEKPTPALVNHTWQNTWNVIGEFVEYKYQVPSCDRTVEELAQLREQGREVLLIPDVLYTPQGLVMLGEAFPLMGSWATDPREAVKIKYGSVRGGCIDIEMSPDAPYRTASGLTEQQLREKIAEDSRRLRRLLTGQRLPTYFIGSQFSQLTKEYFDLRTWSRLPGSVFAGRVLGAAFFYSVGRVYVGNWSPGRQGPDLGGRSEGRKA